MTIENMSFEEALKNLEETVKKLEVGKISLNEMISSYEYALKLKDYCSKKLEEAKIRVNIVANNGGEVELKQFEEEAND
ncbi:exodeoxyribonuclease VII small subunit [Rickettsiales endosymbiont of Stachyamoeba lipophora]|uniref:exodeoxyribonuclease VII small subunit n=1 Tax=Rickettsiales endosymbiont of Stachyamoeba lipophora TaxID=2486578 RepID=UPI000F647CC4|nr:exodeoxyribonuclease VII small subunit [Rickettsiales endosymbiont of Stachyamoeba lipophora]AZL15759.1 exodeoxyribonuclease VII small subunit [Rickettsiales endosymbiont of Stachyamoeba lipophora]